MNFTNYILTPDGEVLVATEVVTHNSPVGSLYLNTYLMKVSIKIKPYEKAKYDSFRPAPEEKVKEMMTHLLLAGIQL